jgi:hypothetical protein
VEDLCCAIIVTDACEFIWQASQYLACVDLPRNISHIHHPFQKAEITKVCTRCELDFHIVVKIVIQLTIVEWYESFAACLDADGMTDKMLLDFFFLNE